ncbi:MAG: ABC transporter permease [Candidatus Cryosericum sp.]
MSVFFGLVSAMMAGATPILLAAIGGTFTFYAGIFNIAMEGMMLVGAFCAVLGSFFLHSWFLGILCAIAGAMVIAAIFVLFAVRLHTDEFLTGIALNLFAVGLTTFLLRDIFHVKGAFTDARLLPIPVVKLPIIDNVPFLGRLLSGYSVIVYVAVVATVLCAYVIFHTRFGLRLRGAGYNAACLSSSGVSPSTIRIWSLVICAICCGLAGAYLSLGYVQLFAENMSAGRGWISLAAIILVSGNPWGIAVISLLFGFFDGLTVFLQGSAIPTQFTAMIPYVATLVSLYFYSVRKRRRA